MLGSQGTTSNSTLVKLQVPICIHPLASIREPLYPRGSPQTLDRKEALEDRGLTDYGHGCTSSRWENTLMSTSQAPTSPAQREGVHVEK
jgi:hypothetical protein